jgi:superfamily II DNA or RNA helicase
MLQEIPIQKEIKKLYPYQQRDINHILENIASHSPGYRLLYQLPTGGGKTVVFSQIARQFIERYNSKVVVLTHRSELSKQTSNTLKKSGVPTKIIDSNLKRLPAKSQYGCYVAMVETLKNRIKEKKISVADVGLVIIDEAHHNSFRKLLENFKNAFVIGVTATPFSSDISLPMYKNYDELLVSDNIISLIDQGFLAKPKTITKKVELNSLQTGIHGDYTVSSSNALYSSPAMLELLKETYEANSKEKKTLIFNNGIDASKKVMAFFEEAGYAIKHLDNKNSSTERKEILQWFKKTKGAILTSVSILTTGFDEPSVQTVILNRATTSLTLYHQMIGRGSRKLPKKKTFSIIDLGNNTERFGEWENPIDWKYVFEKPEEFAQQLHYDSNGESPKTHAISIDLRNKFSNTLELSFNIEEKFKEALEKEEKPKTVIQQSIRQHAFMCIENAETISEALALAENLDSEIDWRVKEYVKCLEKSTKSYRDWLKGDYRSRLNSFIQKTFIKLKTAEIA